MWRRLVKEYNLGNTAVVLLPSKNRNDNLYALLYLDEMLLSRNYDNALILTYDPAVKICYRMFSENILAVQYFPRNEAEDLMQYYCLYEFDDRLIVASLDEPDGRNGSMLNGKRGITLEEIFAMGVYRLYPFMRRELPEYHGTDRKIKKFIYDIDI